MCLQAGLLIGWDDQARRALVARANCDSWKCAECARRMAEHWGLRAEMGSRAIIDKGEKLDFVTITSHEKLPDFAATEAVWRDAWGKLYNALKRQNNGLQYMLVPEQHKSGRMHVHALWNAGVSKRWLKNNARKRGLGYECEVIHVGVSRYAQKYIVKYIGKSFGSDMPEHFRRVRVSQNWADIPTPDNEAKNLRWEYIGTNGALQTVYDECEEKHIQLIDYRTGEIFDDVDLGTIVAS